MSRRGGIRSLIGFFVLVAALVGTALPAHAQWVRRETPRRGSFEASGGVFWTGGTDLANRAATLTRNPSTGSNAFELFRSDATLTSAIGLQARFGAYLSSSLSLEAGAQIGRPELQVRLTRDSEGAPDATAAESITSYVFTGSVVYHLRKAGRRMTPFVLAGAGHVRDLHQGSDLVETGLEYHAGGGVKWWLGNKRRKLGLRGDVGVSARDGGVGADEDRRIVPMAAISLAYLF